MSLLFGGSNKSIQGRPNMAPKIRGCVPDMGLTLDRVFCDRSSEFLVAALGSEPTKNGQPQAGCLVFTDLHLSQNRL